MSGKRTALIAVVTLTICVLTVANFANASETVTYTYDAKGRLVKVEHAGTVNNNVVANYSYDYADNRNQVSVSGAP